MFFREENKMKKIENAAKNYSEIEVNKGNDNDALFCSRIGMKQIIERSFREGVNFAQKWINTNDEKPNHREVVLAKIPMINYPLLFAYSETDNRWFQFDEGDFYISEIIPVSWRSIDLI